MTNRLFYGNSIELAVFSVFMSKIFRPLKLNKKTIRCLNEVFMQSKTKDEMFMVVENYHQILLHKNMKAPPDKSQFLLTRVKFLKQIIEKTIYLH